MIRLHSGIQPNSSSYHCTEPGHIDCPGLVSAGPIPKLLNGVKSMLEDLHHRLYGFLYGKPIDLTSTSQGDS